MAATFIALGAMALTRAHERERQSNERWRDEGAKQLRRLERLDPHAARARDETSYMAKHIAEYRAKITEIERLETSTAFAENLQRNCRSRFNERIQYNENSREAFADVDATLTFLQLTSITIQTLIQAITDGQTGVVRFILNSKVIAVEANANVFQTINVDIVRLLINYGFDATANDNAAIKFAITHDGFKDGAVEVVHLLVQDARCRDPELLTLAIQQKNPWILGALLSHIDPTEKAFHLAVEFAKDGYWLSTWCLNHMFNHPRLNVADYTDCLELILKNPHNSILKSICWHPGTTAFIQEVLLFLCKSPHSLSQIQFILSDESKCRIYLRTFKNAVAIACEYNNPRILKYLLRWKIEVGIDNLFKTACANGRLSIVEVLLPTLVKDVATLIAAEQDARTAGHKEISALLCTKIPWRFCVCF